MSRYIFDIEADSLLLNVTKVHSLVIKDIDTGTVYSYCDQPGYKSIREGLFSLKHAELLVGHNILGFDLPALQKVYDWKFRGEVFDTLVVSRLIWSDMGMEDHTLSMTGKLKNFPSDLVGKHSLEAWGRRMGIHKDDFGKTADWSQWSQEMQDYCEQDVEVNYKLYCVIQKKNYSERAIKLEHDFKKIIHQQEQHGFKFNVEKALELAEILRSRKAVLESELRSVFPDTVEETKTPEYWEGVWEDHTIIGPTRTNVERQIKDNFPRTLSKWSLSPGPFKKKVIQFNPGSRLEIANRLMAKGWVPAEFTDSGQPKVSETVLEGLEFPEAKFLAEYFMVEKRLGQLAEGDKAWLKLQRNGRIHGDVITNGAVTGRCTHNNPNVAQTPAIRAPFGLECRTLFEADEGYVLVGADASGLELRNLGHFMFPWDNGDYGREVCTGDIHTRNQNLAGLATRDDAKTFIYALCYGAGDEKLGTIAGVKPEEVAELKGSQDFKGAKKKYKRYWDKLTEQQQLLIAKGFRLRRRFMEGLPAYRELIDGIRQSVEARSNARRIELGLPRMYTGKVPGWVKGLDGRILPVRSAHAALNTLLQSAGALIVKLGTVLLYNSCLERGWVFGKDFANVAHIHDEVQIQARPEIAEELGKLAVESFAEAGRQFNFTVPITGTYSVGRNWAETH